jgi:hypothetical protein
MSNKTFIAFVNLVDKYEKTLNELDDPDLIQKDKLFAITMDDFKKEFVSYWLLIEQYARLKVFGNEEEMIATLHEMQIIIDKKNEPVSEFFL